MINNNIKGVLDTMNRVYYKGLTTTSGGNISCMDENGAIFITPSAIDKGTLNIGDIVEVKADRTIIGKHNPSIELPFHSNIYAERADLRAVVHAHAPAIVAYATARRTPNSAVAPCFSRIIGEVTDSVYDLPGSTTLGDIVKAKFNKGYNSVMMHNHGATVGGDTLESAFVRYEALENLCQTIINAGILGGVKMPASTADYSVEFNRCDCTLSDADTAIASELVAFIKRSYGQGLVASGYGTFFYKLPNGDILFNPDSISRDTICIEDVVKYSNGSVAGGGSDTKCDYLDIAIKMFDTIPEAVTCFISMPSAAMGFAVSNKYFDAKLIPESYIMLKNCVQLPCGIAAIDIAGSMATDKPMAIIDNECVVAIGKNFVKAFDRMEVTDFSARSIIQATNIADINPINDEEAADIDRVFNGW